MPDKPLCPICHERKLKRSTCGHFLCQYKHHIRYMRTKRKTDRKVPSRRIRSI